MLAALILGQVEPVTARTGTRIHAKIRRAEMGHTTLRGLERRLLGSVPFLLTTSVDLLLYGCHTEGVGFEPTVPLSRDASFQNWCNKPDSATPPEVGVGTRARTKVSVF